MTDRFHSLTVVLDQDIRSDDAEILINAIKALRHVISCTGNVADIESHMAIARARSDLTDKILDALRS